jgi:hypothetical protein
MIYNHLLSCYYLCLQICEQRSKMYPGGSMSWVVGCLTTHTSLSPIWRGFVPGFVNYKKDDKRL